MTTGERDLHSGMYGGAALNAVHVLMRCFDAVLAGPNGLLPEPLRAGIAAPTAEELELVERAAARRARSSRRRARGRSTRTRPSSSTSARSPSRPPT